MDYSEDSNYINQKSFEETFNTMFDNISLNIDKEKRKEIKVKTINCISSDMQEKLANTIVSMRDFRESSLFSPTIYDNLIITTSASSSNSESVNELKCLLDKPWIKEYLKCSENVCKNVCSEKLPDIPFEVDDDEGIAVKYVKLVKHNEPLGVTIKCKTDGRIVISRIMANGIADKSGVIQVGDSILGINDISVSDMKPNDIAKLLNSKNEMTLKLLPALMNDYSDEKNAHSFYRAMVGYNGRNDPNHPVPEAAISFERGDILEILVADDPMWLQAANLGNGSLASIASMTKKENDNFKIGLIPSNICFQKIVSTIESERKFQRIYYESVVKFFPKVDCCRPIVLIGPSGVGRNELKKRLVLLNKDVYSTPVPHTSRAMRPHETNGVEYNFVSKRQMQQWINEGRFIEHGEYKGNYYGTLDLSILSLINESKIPVLNPQPTSIKLLRNHHFKSIIIFIQPPSFDILKETRLRKQAKALSTNQSAISYGAGFTDADLNNMITSAAKIDHIYGQYFDARIVNDDLEIAFKKLTDIIHAFHTQPSWIPKDWLSDV
uniref:MAGUK p55 subfamily member 7 n=1 Tax=Strongyloides papillosus TaxID=174720 RepID=A0A0N5BA96_STREA